MAPPSGMESISRNLRFGLEMLGRFRYAEQDDAIFTGGFGAEWYTQIVTESGTWGTLEAQFRIIFGKKRRADFQAHNVYLEKRFLFGRLNLMVGHFQVPFGLEALPIDTHTTVVQLSNPRMLGFKHDWGVALRGQLTGLDYELAYTIGSGMDPEFETAGMGTGRIGFETAGDWLGAGLSVTGGERLVAGESATGWRVGADLTWRFGIFRLLTEGSAGSDDGYRALSFLGRLEASAPGDGASGVIQYQVTEIQRPSNTQVIQWGEVELALRLSFITRQSFLRLNLAIQDQEDQQTSRLLALFYLRFE